MIVFPITKRDINRILKITKIGDIYNKILLNDEKEKDELKNKNEQFVKNEKEE